MLRYLWHNWKILLEGLFRDGRPIPNIRSERGLGVLQLDRVDLLSIY
jgi:hypothetical protein